MTTYHIEVRKESTNGADAQNHLVEEIEVLALMLTSDATVAAHVLRAVADQLDPPAPVRPHQPTYRGGGRVVQTSGEALIVGPAGTRRPADDPEPILAPGDLLRNPCGAQSPEGAKCLRRHPRHFTGDRRHSSHEGRMDGRTYIWEDGDQTSK